MLRTRSAEEPLLMSELYDVIIIGGGSAGSVAATFLAAHRWKTLLLDKNIDEGYLASLGHIHFFPGLLESITGHELTTRLHQQAHTAGAIFTPATVTSVMLKSSPFEIQKEDGKQEQTKALLLTTGAASRTHFAPGEKELRGKGVYYDALLDGPSVQGKTMAVVGKSAHSAEEAILLARFASTLYFIIPSSKLDIPDHLFHLLEKKSNIEFLFSTSLKSIEGKDQVEGITVLSAGAEKGIAIDAVFSYLSDYQTTHSYLEGTVELADNKTVLVDTTMSTSIKGVFAAGDILCGQPQIPTVAAAQGIIAAINIDHFLRSL